MLKTLLDKEIKNHLQSMRFIFAFIAVISVMLTGFKIRLDDHHRALLDQRANFESERQRHEDSYWWRLQYSGIFVERPISPLRVIIAGADHNPDPRAQVFDRTHPMIRSFGSIDRNPMLSLFTPVDFMYITGIIMSLMVLVLSYDAVSGEREDGTLKLLMSFPIPRSTIIFAKWLGGVITLVIPFLIGSLIIAIWIQLSPRISFAAEDWLAYSLIGIASLLYIAWMFSASLLVSCRCRTSSTSMCLLLSLWVVLVLVVPNLSLYVAARWFPTESLQSVNYRSMKIGNEIQQIERKKFDALKAKYKVNRWWQDEDAWQEGILLQTELHDQQRTRTRAIVDRSLAKANQQIDASRNLGRLSPFTSYASIVSELAWTGPSFDTHFLQNLRVFEDQVRRIVTRGMQESSNFSFERLPRFRYAAPHVADRFNAMLLDWALLITGTLVFYLGAFVSFVNREVI